MNNDFYVFPNTTLTNLELSSCRDTISGICPKVSSLQECINICSNSPECKNGYYANDNCFPLKNIDQVPIYARMIKGNNSTVFSKKSDKFIPDDTNTIFYGDNFMIKNFSKNYMTNENSKISFSKFGIEVQIFPSTITEKILRNSIPVCNGDKITINIPNTTFVFSLKDNSTEIIWDTTASSSETDYSTFEIYSSNPDKKKGDKLNYDDMFFFTFHGQTLSYNNDIMGLSSLISLENSLFTLVPYENVFYCSVNCLTIKLFETEMKDFSSTYKGNKVYRNPNCWNICKPLQNKKFVKKDYGKYFIIFIMVVFLCFLLYTHI